MKTHPRFSLVILCFCLISIHGLASTLSKESLGIAPQDIIYFKSETIKCKDGSKKFTKTQLNDDFCDCPDGTDEPGTSACPEGKFYCWNAGHVPLTLFSSRVNDGICDCCDGTDEYGGKVNCSNTCWEAGNVARDKLKKKIATYQDGVTIRKREVGQARQAFAKDEAALLKLQKEEEILKELVQKLKEHKEQIENAEEQERQEKEREEERLREAEKRASEKEKGSDETLIDETKSVPEEPPESLKQNAGIGMSPKHVVDQHVADNNDNNMEEAESGNDAGNEASHSHGVNQERESSDNAERLSREELGRLVASRWAGENSGQQTDELDGAKEREHEANLEISNNAQDDDYDGYTSESDEDGQRFDVDETEDINMDADHREEQDNPSVLFNSESEDETDFSDLTTPSNPSWLDKIQHTVQNIMQAVSLFKTPIDKSEADHIRKEYDDSSIKLSKMQSRISRMSEKLKHDFGIEKEFYSFYGHCFENKQNKYVYKICPFKKASQVDGHSTTELGYWEKFADSYRTMQFSSGSSCWNGPNRSLRVKLRCGLNNELSDVDEPSRCEYVAVLSTPTLCLEEKLKELEHKLALMNMEQPQRHDEL